MFAHKNDLDEPFESNKNGHIEKSIVQFSEALGRRKPVGCWGCLSWRSNVPEIKAVPLAQRGVTAGLVQAVCSLISQDSSFGNWALEHTTRDLLSWVKKTAVMPDGESEDGTSLCELVGTKLNTELYTQWYSIFYPLNCYRPKKFMSYAWDYPVMFMWRLWEYGHVEFDDALWIDVFTVNQLNKEKQSDDLGALQDAIKKIGHTILVLDEKAYALTRCWCIFEVFHTIQSGSEFELAFMNSVKKGERWGFVCDYILLLLAYVGRFDGLDTKNAIATKEADKRIIFSDIEDTIGFTKVNAVVRDGIRNAAEVALKRGLERFQMRGLTEEELVDWGTLVRKVGINWFTTADGLLDPSSLGFQQVFDALKSCFWGPVKTEQESKEIYINCSELCQRSVLPSEQLVSTSKSSEVVELLKVVSDFKDAPALETILSIRRITFILENYLDTSDIETIQGDPYEYEVGLSSCSTISSSTISSSFDEYEVGLNRYVTESDFDLSNF